MDEKIVFSVKKVQGCWYVDTGDTGRSDAKEEKIAEEGLLAEESESIEDTDPRFRT